MHILHLTALTRYWKMQHKRTFTVQYDMHTVQDVLPCVAGVQCANTLTAEHAGPHFDKHSSQLLLRLV